MSFDIDKLESASFTDRTKEVPVPSMKDFFDKDEKAVFLVRGLTGAEIGRANEAQEKNRDVSAILSSLVSASGKDKADGVMDALGLDPEEVPNDVVRRQEIMHLGLVSPALERNQVVKISEAYPVDFYNITNEILKLSGQGRILGKQKPSGTAEG